MEGLGSTGRQALRLPNRERCKDCAALVDDCRQVGLIEHVIERMPFRHLVRRDLDMNGDRAVPFGSKVNAQVRFNARERGLTFKRLVQAFAASK